MTPRWLGWLLATCGLLLAAVVLFGGGGSREQRTEWRPGDAVQPVGLVVAATLGALGAIHLLTSSGRGGQTRTLVRLDCFLPFLRKKKKNETLGAPPVWLRAAQRVLPAGLFSDRVTGRPGLARRLLKRIGPTAHSAPVRRFVQSICFALFLYLFLYVCWPYSSRPAPAGAVSKGWRVVEVQQESGQIELARAAGMGTIRPSGPHKGNDDAVAFSIETGSTVYLVDERAIDAIRGEFAAMRIRQIAGDANRVTAEESPDDAPRTEAASAAVAADSHSQHLVAEPLRPLTEEQWIALLTATGTWSLHETSPWPSHYTDDLAAKERLPAESFLSIDPLVSLSTAIASRSWVWSLISAGAILIVCVAVPRGFCGYLCPLGTLIDLFDWTISSRVERFRVSDDGWWVHLKYYVLAGTLVAATCGVLVSGYVAAIPVISRGMLFLAEPLQSGVLRGWEHVPPMNAGHVVSIGLFLVVLGLGFLRPRFWCKYVCPSGAVFSLGNLFRLTERKVESSCIHCNKCIEICPFDAIKPDFTTRVTDCTLCQTCAGVCPTHSIKFVERWNLVELKVQNDPPTNETPIGRRGFVSLAAGVVGATVGGAGLSVGTKLFGAGIDDPKRPRPVRPPGSVPEREFLQMCIRCGECFKACPFNVLQPMGFEQGLEGLWTPRVVADHAGCAPSCNACGQVCPTGAIRALTLDEKRVARMGLAIVDEQTCLPLVGREACQVCVDECASAGYHAIEFIGVHTKMDESGQPIEGSGFLAPVVLKDQCVGCGLCQMGCYRVNVAQKNLLDESAIVMFAGEDREDRVLIGSYAELRQRRNSAGKVGASPPANATEPHDGDSNKPSNDNQDPFGVGAP